VFFSFGAVLSAIIGFLVLPGASCIDAATCDRESGQNDGWRRMLFILGLIVSTSGSISSFGRYRRIMTRQNLAMFAARFLLFRLHESPRFLVSKRKTDEALAVLKKIADFNDRPLALELRDVHGKASIESYRTVTVPEAKPSEPESISASSPTGQANLSATHPGIVSSNSSAYLDFASAREYGTPPPLENGVRSSTIRTTSTLHGHSFHTPSEELSQARAFPFASDTHRNSSEEDNQAADDTTFDSSTLDLEQDEQFRTMGLRQVLDNGSARLQLLFVPKWKQTTMLMWTIWGLMSLAYGM
jgi:hypothetical protein